MSVLFNNYVKSQFQDKSSIFPVENFPISFCDCKTGKNSV